MNGSFGRGGKASGDGGGNGVHLSALEKKGGKSVSRSKPASGDRVEGVSRVNRAGPLDAVRRAGAARFGIGSHRSIVWKCQGGSLVRSPHTLDGYALQI